MRLLRRIEGTSHETWEVDDDDRGLVLAIFFLREHLQHLRAWLDGEGARRFEGEARVLGEARWAPPGGDRVAVLFEHPTGDRAIELLEKFGWLDEELACGVLRGLCAALGARHRAGTSHGELSLGLVWVDGFQVTVLPPMLLELLARRPGSELSSRDPRADGWALGMIGFRLLTGREYGDEPVPSDPPSRRARTLGVAETPAWFDRWFFRCTGALERFADAREAADAIGVPLPASAGEVRGLGDRIRNASAEQWRVVVEVFSIASRAEAEGGLDDGALDAAFDRADRCWRAGWREGGVAIVDAIRAWEITRQRRGEDPWRGPLAERRAFMEEQRGLVDLVPANIHALLGEAPEHFARYVRARRAEMEALARTLGDYPLTRARIEAALAPIDRPAPRPRRVAAPRIPWTTSRVASTALPFVVLVGFVILLIKLGGPGRYHDPHLPSAFSMPTVFPLPSLDLNGLVLGPFDALGIRAQIAASSEHDPAIRDELEEIERGARAEDCATIRAAIDRRASLDAGARADASVAAEPYSVAGVESLAIETCSGPHVAPPKPSDASP